MKLRFLVILAFVSVLIVPGYIFGYGGGGAPPPDMVKTETPVSEFISLPGAGVGGKDTLESEWGWVVIGAGHGIGLTKNPLAGGSSGNEQPEEISDDTKYRRKVIRDLISGYKRGHYTKYDVRNRAESLRVRGVFTQKDADVLLEVLDDIEPEPPPLWKAQRPGEYVYLYCLLHSDELTKDKVLITIILFLSSCIPTSIDF